MDTDETDSFLTKDEIPQHEKIRVGRRMNPDRRLRRQGSSRSNRSFNHSSHHSDSHRNRQHRHNSNQQRLPHHRRRSSQGTRSSSVSSDALSRSMRLEEIRASDEVFMLYTRTEKAALQIQKAFRSRQTTTDGIASRASILADDSTGDIDFSSSTTSLGSDTKGPSKADDPPKDVETDRRRFTMIFLALSTFSFCCYSIVQQCYKCFAKSSSDGEENAIADKAITDPATTGGGGGGGGGGAEAQAPAQAAMASNAAGAAGSAAASGVGAAAAGAAVAGAAVAAGGFGAAVASAVGVSAVVATVATVATQTAVSANATLPVTSLVPSSCGIEVPDLRQAQLTIWLEGFTDIFDSRETSLLETVVIDAYNNITMGPTGEDCNDKYLREMYDAVLVDQQYFPATEFNNSYIETTFNTSLICDGCPLINPLFGDSTILRRRLQEQLEANEFFIEVLRNVLVEVKELSVVGEISDDFIQLSRGFLPEQRLDGQDDLDTQISATFNNKNEVAAIRFQYRKNGVLQVTTVNVAAPTLAPTMTPTTSAPTMVPTLSFMPSPVDATAAPSAVPSIVPTDYPSQLPSESPSNIPSFVPSESPSTLPSTMPSAAPSTIPTAGPTNSPVVGPTVQPSIRPTLVPSVEPSNRPSMVPSMRPSFVPSFEPSDTPSMVPSTVPSNSPSALPSLLPSVVPSDIPSGVPSAVPSVVPSMLPSLNPSATPSITPTLSQVPSDSPSDIPSSSPTQYPTRSPTFKPTPYPSISNRPTPCIWRAAERQQSRIGNGPNEYCIGTDQTRYHVPVHIIDQSQDGDTVSFRLLPVLFRNNTTTRISTQFESTCDVQTVDNFDSARVFDGTCTNGSLEVKFYVYLCGSEVNATGDACAQPSDLDNYREFRYLLDCYEVCETEGPTSGPTHVPSDSPSQRPSFIPTGAPTHLPTLDPTTKPTYVPTGAPTSKPTFGPSSPPTQTPTDNPTNGPTSGPTDVVTSNPTNGPTSIPTEKPTPSST